MKKFTLLIVTDNAIFRERLETYLRDTGMFDVLPPAADGPSAVAKIRMLAPDMLLLDMLMPGMDGIEVLRRARAEGIGDKMRVFTFSSMKQDSIMHLADSLGITYHIQMPTDESMIFSRLMDFAPDNDEYARRLRKTIRENDMAVQVDELMTEALRKLGAPVNLAGYYQIKTVLAFCIRHYARAVNLSIDAYPYAARIHNVNEKQIERNIRTWIEVTWTRGNLAEQHILFGYTIESEKGRPTNKEFIATMTQHLVQRLRRSSM
ncbi:MAG: response regulator [Christensenellaceae bacterium]|jgi:two-component system response regulator (stage 0 sporulation protein A)|nr:response regulator [Christensenellaceae bacterium]